MDSILNSVKKAIGLAAEYHPFDPDIIMYINSVFVILTQMGVGPTTGFSISNEFSKWNEFIPDGTVLELVKTYMGMKVQLMFDPPANSTIAESKRKLIDELEWRISVEVDPGSRSDL